VAARGRYGSARPCADNRVRAAASPAPESGTFGFSGGGGRSLLLAALQHRITASVVSCMMATFGSLVPNELDTHSWLLHVPGLWSLMDWPS
jgi:hypothetical protein